MGLSVTVGLAPERSALASGRAVLMTSFAVLLAPLTVGTLADATSLTAALGVLPVVLALAAVGLALVRRAQRRAAPRPEPSPHRLSGLDPGSAGRPRRSRCSDRSTALCGPPARGRKEWGSPVTWRTDMTSRRIVPMLVAVAVAARRLLAACAGGTPAPGSSGRRRPLLPRIWPR